MSWQAGFYVAAALIPLAAFVVELIGIRLFGRLNAYLATAAIGLSFLLSAAGFVNYFFMEPGSFFSPHEVAAPALTGNAAEKEPAKAEEVGHQKHHEPLVWEASYDWVLLGGDAFDSKAGKSLPALVIPLAVHIDSLTVIMFAMVTLIATLIHIYSMGYMHDDPGYPRFFTYLSLFCFSMLGLVASGNVFMIFIFWELVGVCSYLLIGFWYQDKKNSDAANKAFIVNRVGDVGMLVGLGLIWTSLGTFNIHEINTSASRFVGKVEPVGDGRGSRRGAAQGPTDRTGVDQRGDRPAAADRRGGR